MHELCQRAVVGIVETPIRVPICESVLLLTLFLFLCRMGMIFVFIGVVIKLWGRGSSFVLTYFISLMLVTYSWFFR